MSTVKQADGQQGKRRSVGRPATARKRGHLSLATSSADAPMAAIQRSPDCELINSLARGLQVLAVFGPERQTLSNKEISALTGIPKPSVSRLTDTLLKLSFLGQDPDTGLYRLGPSALALGVSNLQRRDLASIARPYAAEFAATHKVNLNLGVLDGLEVRVSTIKSAESAQAPRMALGASFSLHGTAAGLALMAGLPREDFDALSASLKDALGAEWGDAERRIAAALKEYRTYGYCTVVGEWGGVMSSLATPLLVENSDGRLAIGCTGLSEVLTEERRRQLAPYFVGLVETIRAAARQEYSGRGGGEAVANKRELAPLD